MASVQRIATDTIDRMMAKTVRLPWSGCTVFTGSLDTSGYGLIGVGGSGNIRKTHRVAFEHSVGPIPDGLQVLHRCDVRCCVNPDHLFLGTLQDNMTDRNAKGRQARLKGMRHNLHKLTDSNVIEAVALWKAGRSVKAIADQFGVTVHAIYPIINGTGWTHITKDLL